MDASFSGLMGLLLLLSNTSGDLVTTMNADDYFRIRGIDTGLDKMMELAAKDPVDGKTQIQQLLALRVLGESPKKFKDHFKAAAAAKLKILKDIGLGKKAQDKEGFAQEFAVWAHNQISPEEQIPPVNAVSALKPVQRVGLSCFPKDLTQAAAALDVESGRSPGFAQTKEMRALSDLATKLSPKDREIMYSTIEEFGNIRITRFAVGFQYDGEKMPENAAFYVHIHGKANHKRLASLLKQQWGLEKEAIESIAGPITIARPAVNQFAVALLGNGELFVAGYLTGPPKTKANPGARDNRPDLIKQMLAIREGREANAHSGVLANDLKTIAPNANGFLIAALPKALIRDLTRRQSPFRAVPSSVIIATLPKGQGMDVHFRGNLASAEDAKAFSDTVAMLRAKVLEDLSQAKDVPKEFVPFLGSFKKSLESLQMKADGSTAVATMHVPSSSLLALPIIWLMAPGDPIGETPQKRDPGPKNTEPEKTKTKTPPGRAG